MTGLIGKWSCVKILKYNREAVESCQMERPGFFLSRGPFFSFLCISDGGWGTSASLLVGRRRVVIGAVVAHSTEHAFRNVIPFFLFHSQLLASPLYHRTLSSAGRRHSEISSKELLVQSCCKLIVCTPTGKTCTTNLHLEHQYKTYFTPALCGCEVPLVAF